jgi:predicted NBD/HSP70 family sugar kinase
MTGRLLDRSGMPRAAQQANDITPLDRLPKSERVVAYQLLQRGPASQGDLVARTGLSRPTVAASLTSLMQDRLAEMLAGQDAAQGEGRRAQLYRLTSKVGTAVGVEIGRRHVTVVLIDAGHQQILQDEEDVAASADDHPIEVLTQSAALVRRAITQANVEESVLGLAVGLPVPVTADGRIGSKTFMPAWADIDAAGELARQLGLRPVHVANEADLGALGEYVFGFGRGTRDLTYLKLGTGIGAGIIVDGQLQMGASGTAGEFGHITVDYRGRRCRCGNRGCLERYAGGEALLYEAREAGLEIENIPTLVSRAHSGDVACERIVTEAASIIGAGLGALVNLNGPTLIVLSGSLSAAGELLTRPLREALNRAAFPPAAQAVSIEFASLDRRASACGAAALVFERHASKCK